LDKCLSNSGAPPHAAGAPFVVFAPCPSDCVVSIGYNLLLLYIPITLGPLLNQMMIILKSNECIVSTHVTITFCCFPVEEASSSGCSAEPVATGQTPQTNTKLIVAPYEQVDVTATFTSELERYPQYKSSFQY